MTLRELIRETGAKPDLRDHLNLLGNIDNVLDAEVSGEKLLKENFLRDYLQSKKFSEDVAMILMGLIGAKNYDTSYDAKYLILQFYIIGCNQICLTFR